jgi:hypothetical protein
MVRALALTALLLLAPAAFAAETKPAEKPAPKVSLTKEQQERVALALKALRKLHAAIEVGVTLADYRSRLIDAKVDVEEQTRKLPEGKVRELLTMAVTTHQEALTLWNDVNEHPYKSIIKDDPTDWAIITDHKLPWTEPTDEVGSIPAWEKSVWLKALWMIAGNQISGAEEAAS